MSTKEHILALLESHRGAYISGAYIAGLLGISRNAVWKAIKELEKDGHKISATTNRGYCLAEDDDILSVQGMLPFLADSAYAERIFIHDLLESTNITAKQMAMAKAGHGTVVLAERQSLGKGRFDRHFHSPPGSGIYMSLILQSEYLKLESPTLVTVLAAVAVCEAIEALSDRQPRIKWVNDVLIGEKKICGILSEAVLDFESRTMPWVVVGIGINVKTRPQDFPEELRQRAGSLFPEGKAMLTRNRLVAEIINRMLATGHGDSVDLLQRYKARLMMLGRKIMVMQMQESYEATALDIDASGQLVVQRENGEISTLSAGEISIRL